MKTFLEYKYNTVVLSISMFFNDLFWIFFYWILFNQAGSINSWVFADSIMLFGVTTFSYGLSVLFFYNWNYIHSIVLTGKLDYFLLKPIDPLFHVLINRSTFTAFGELLMGFACFLFVYGLSISHFLLFVFFSITATLLYTATQVLVSCLVFYVGRSSEIVNSFQMGFLTFTMYPTHIYSGITKIILYTVFPAFFISTLPVELLRDFNIVWCLGIVLFTLFYCSAVYFIFNKGLKNYESGNLVLVNV